MNISKKDTKSKNVVIPSEKMDGIIERTKGAIERINNNIYGEIKHPLATANQINNAYKHPFHENYKEEVMDTIDRLDVLEYDTDLFQNDVKNRSDISISQDNYERGEDFNIDMKDYDNFIIKIEDLVITDDKVLGKLRDSLLCIEFKVPLYKSESKLNEPGNQAGIFYDTFKYFKNITV
jgi:hypothetical protein